MQNYKAIIKNESSLELTPYFISYKSEDDEFYHFVINFSLLQSDIVKNSLSKVKISAYNDYVSDNNLGQKYFFGKSILSVKEKFDPIKKALTKHYEQKTLSQEKNSSLISTATVENLSSSVFYGAIEELKTGKNPKDVSVLYKSVKTLKEFSPIDKIKIPLYNSASEDIRDENLTLISRYLVDPSEVFYQNFDNKLSHDIFVKIRNFYLNRKNTSGIEDSLYKVELEKRLVDRIVFTCNFSISKKFSVVGSLDIVFEVYQNDVSVPIDVRTKKFEPLKLSKNQTFITSRPDISFSGNHLVVLQKDQNADSIQILKKELNNVGAFTKYSISNENKTLAGKTNTIDAQKYANKICIYRALSQSSLTTMKSFSYKNIVVGDPINLDQTGLIITDKDRAIGALQLTVINQPSNATQYKITRKQVVAGVIREDTLNTIVKYKNFSGLTTISEDNSVKNDEIYEYTVYYKLSTGEERKSVSQIYRYVNSSVATTVSTIVTNPTFDSYKGKPRIQFTIQSQIKEQEADKIKMLLKQSDIYEEFSTEMEKINDTFGKLIAHQVVRVNMKNGLREVFLDFLPNGSFVDDIQSRQKFSISEIDDSSSYLYEIRTFLRNPLSLFRDYVKTVTVTMGQGTKTYYYRPYKWRQPTTLSTGTILSQDNEKNIISQKSLLEDGEIGVTASYLATNLSKIKSATNLIAERIDLHKVKISWEISEDFSEYDHFVVVKEVNGHRKILGAFSSIEIIDNLDEDNDLGTVAYYVTPVLNDYSVGTTNRTNSIFVDPEDFNFTKNFF